MNHYQVVPECFADTLLVEMLGFTRPNHQLGIGKVLGIFERQLRNRRAVGIIDNDKVKPKALDAYEQTNENHDIIWKSKGNHHILIINPGFEQWIFKNAAEVNVDPGNYGFGNRKLLQNACKSENAARNQNLKNFLGLLRQRNAPGFVLLKTWICEAAGIDEQDLD